MGSWKGGKEGVLSNQSKIERSFKKVLKGEKKSKRGSKIQRKLSQRMENSLMREAHRQNAAMAVQDVADQAQDEY